MTPTSEQLLDELVVRWTRGEPLEVEELLSRAGPEADELATLIDAFLARAPRREPTPAAVAFVQSLDTPPLLRARQERRLKLDDLVSRLIQRLGLPESARAKVRRYYQELELGQLDPAGVAAAVWEELAGLLGRDIRGLAGAFPPSTPLGSTGAMYRLADSTTTDFDSTTTDFDIEPDRMAEPSLAARSDEPDVVDRLFGVTSAD
jgi:hypothetical protein